mmetsp:Transcript_15236/g.16946  ORF Transcript_15236/g.16946 Transcript_15236/m.16946 type:complete len:226 (-) Transcript_15236:538-1215(-)
MNPDFTGLCSTGNTRRSNQNSVVKSITCLVIKLHTRQIGFGQLFKNALKHSRKASIKGISFFGFLTNSSPSNDFLKSFLVASSSTKGRTQLINSVRTCNQVYALNMLAHSVGMYLAAGACCKRAISFCITALNNRSVVVAPSLGGITSYNVTIANPTSRTIVLDEQVRSTSISAKITSNLSSVRYVINSPIQRVLLVNTPSFCATFIPCKICRSLSPVLYFNIQE